MSRYVALLRGIAPSGKNMTNDKLRGVFQELGFAAVGSVLSSGNITFEATEPDPTLLEERIESALADRLDLRSRTLVRERADIGALVDGEPFAGLTHGPETYLTATFVKLAPHAEAPVVSSEPNGYGIRYDPAARVLLAVIDNREPGNSTRLMSWLENAYGKDITTRSWLTVQRILRALDAGDATHL